MDRQRSHLLRRGILAALALPLALACGGEAPKPPDPAPAPAADARPAPPAQAPPAANTQEPDGTVVATVRGTDGRSFDAEFGKEGQLPRDFPADVPLYGEARPMSSMASVEHGTIVNLRSHDAPDRIFAWYKERYLASGWEIEHDSVERGRSLVAARKGNRLSSVSITGVPEFTQIMLTVTEDR